MNNPPSFLQQHKYTAARATGIVLVVAVLFAYNLWARDAAEADALAQEQITQAKLASGPGPYATDGTFLGTATGYGGDVTMSVTVENGWITSVEVVDASHEDEAWLEMASVLPERIVEAQTPGIDVVSGATFTSTGMLNAATEALVKSMEGGENGES